MCGIKSKKNENAVLPVGLGKKEMKAQRRLLD